MSKCENLIVKHAPDLYLPLEALLFDLFHALVAFSFSCLQILLELAKEALGLLDQVEGLFFQKADFPSQALPLSMLGFAENCVFQALELLLDELECGISLMLIWVPSG